MSLDTDSKTTTAQRMAEVEADVRALEAVPPGSRISAAHKAVDRLVGVAAAYGKHPGEPTRMRLGKALRETHEALDAVVVILRTLVPEDVTR